MIHKDEPPVGEFRPRHGGAVYPNETAHPQLPVQLADEQVWEVSEVERERSGSISIAKDGFEIPAESLGSAFLAGFLRFGIKFFGNDG